MTATEEYRVLRESAEELAKNRDEMLARLERVNAVIAVLQDRLFVLAHFTTTQERTMPADVQQEPTP